MATEHFTSKARIAIGSIWKPLIVTKTNNFEAAKTLFSAIIKSIMLYDVGIWGLQYTAEMERVAVEFEKGFLNVPKYTPGYMIRLETGRTHLDYDIIKKALSFCGRLANIREGRLPRKCWEKMKLQDRTNADNKKNWISQLKNKLKEYGHIEDNVENLKTATVQQSRPSVLCFTGSTIIIQVLKKIQSKLFETDQNRMLNSTYNVIYKRIKDNVTSLRAQYLNLNIPTTIKRIIAQIRLSGKLGWIAKIGNGLSYKIDGNEICQMCNRNEKEDIVHVLKKCPQYQQIRPVSLNDMEITDILRFNNEKLIWETVNFIKTSLKVRAFCLGE
ncbi:hypothetical protein KPH14_012257 [Odynerus spinipes]|uniref:Reverse transcriptase domain-containing protein n=1 Tax=Odynerus spinipes TaxID=1348599 RepID=A0AAD9RG79_9HYME|nr:hypothetical protein KPH14_012257 [Odynerus spinipes]